MMFKKSLRLGGILLTLCAASVQAQPELKPFISGSYQKILDNNTKIPFMGVVN
jgi:hypothetical protein